MKAARGRSGPDGCKVDVDAVAAELARAQHGIAARRQLLDAGVPPHAVDYRVRKGRFHVLYRGVYRVGPLAGPREPWMAAVLACGEGAVVSHRSAAEVWELLPPRADGSAIDVSTDGGYRDPGSGVRLHRVRRWGRHETARFDGVPVTAPARTILDLSASAGGDEVEQAMARADRRRLAGERQIRRLVERYPGRPGVPLLRALLDRRVGPALSRSEAESMFFAVVRRAGLPPPETNVRVRGFEVDCVWRDVRLVVEIDGYDFHASRTSFESDRRRDAVLAAAGFRVIRVTWQQLVHEPEALLVRVAQALAIG